MLARCRSTRDLDLMTNGQEWRAGPPVQGSGGEPSRRDKERGRMTPTLSSSSLSMLPIDGVKFCNLRPSRQEWRENPTIDARPKRSRTGTSSRCPFSTYSEHSRLRSGTSPLAEIELTPFQLHCGVVHSRQVKGGVLWAVRRTTPDWTQPPHPMHSIARHLAVADTRFPSSRLEPAAAVVVYAWHECGGNSHEISCTYSISTVCRCRCL